LNANFECAVAAHGTKNPSALAEFSFSAMFFLFLEMNMIHLARAVTAGLSTRVGLDCVWVQRLESGRAIYVRACAVTVFNNGKTYT
jgi:hypothetical protein